MVGVARQNREGKQATQRQTMSTPDSLLSTEYSTEHGDKRVMTQLKKLKPWLAVMVMGDQTTVAVFR